MKTYKVMIKIEMEVEADNLSELKSTINNSIDKLEFTPYMDNFDKNQNINIIKRYWLKVF